ncbi:hypothetical protein [Desulfosporosinus sp.]|nr:hypothetical protein [Desulfosporosinus sp.]
MDQEIIEMVKRAKVGGKEMLIKLIVREKTGLLSIGLRLYEKS